ncbi:hypothetical protein Scep_013711 [Stephania cephalantha]|uniref:Uncharacterized protein n=1 Tax=Stephania cephalantha TaxID=152367 RepID=A0AAP0J0Q2_9MAGN
MQFKKHHLARKKIERKKGSIRTKYQSKRRDKIDFTIVDTYTINIVKHYMKYIDDMNLHSSKYYLFLKKKIELYINI